VTTSEIRFNDGAAYERYMGRWSQAAGERFLDWLAAEPGWSWLDVGCGNGAFTELVTGRLAPHAIAGIDPSEAQITYARSRPALHEAELRQGDAMALPWPAAAFDVAVMPLVIFFVPDPARGVGEDRPGSTPVIGTLQSLDVGEVDAVQQQLRRMQAAESLPHPLVEDAVVGNRRFPAHAADQPERAHGLTSSSGCTGR